MGTLYAAMGLIFGLLFALISLAGVALPQQGNGPNPVGIFIGFGVFGVIVMPILYGIMGFIGGIISAAIYNVVAAVVGGIELDFERPATPMTTA